MKKQTDALGKRINADTTYIALSPFTTGTPPMVARADKSYGGDSPIVSLRPDMFVPRGTPGGQIRKILNTRDQAAKAGHADKLRGLQAERQRRQEAEQRSKTEKISRSTERLARIQGQR